MIIIRNIIFKKEVSQNRKNYLLRILHLLPFRMIEVDGLHELDWFILLVIVWIKNGLTRVSALWKYVCTLHIVAVIRLHLSKKKNPLLKCYIPQI